MTTAPAPYRVPAAPVLVAGVGAPLVAAAAVWLLPPLALVSGLLAILATAGAARYVTRGRSGAVLARTGLAVGLTSAVVGLIIGGLGFVAILLAGITVVAGVAGAVAGRGVTSRDLP
ncbi:MAG: hypothetical protein QOF00_6129 [Pseudonocardiales bacterium]|jgi:hypothetical protein|nr:hypothetical protein [Pseudonocardiales bacterium]